MAVHSKLMDVLPKQYGCVVFTAVGSLLVNQWMIFNVMRARSKYNVKVLCLVLILFPKFSSALHRLGLGPYFLY